MPNWNQAQPAPITFAKLVKAVYSESEIPKQVPAGTNYQIFNAAHPPWHSKGVAIDIFLDANKESEKKIADFFFKLCIEEALDLGIHHVIWNRQIWSLAKPSVEPYVGKFEDGRPKHPHTDHIHICWTDPGSQKTSWGHPAIRLYMRQ